MGAAVVADVTLSLCCDIQEKFINFKPTPSIGSIQVSFHVCYVPLHLCSGCHKLLCETSMPDLACARILVTQGCSPAAPPVAPPAHSDAAVMFHDTSAAEVQDWQPFDAASKMLHPCHDWGILEEESQNTQLGKGSDCDGSFVMFAPRMIKIWC